MQCGASRLQRRVRKVHPEGSFRAWNAGKPLQRNRKTPAGRAERTALIATHFWSTADNTVRARIHEQAQGSKPPRVAADAIVDAFAALWTAERPVRGEARTPPHVRCLPRLRRGTRR